ncbi:inositol monophosphatase family protein [Actinophytocola glycyrrhizae]|uniref:inositol-phosphate phosphatase n=1 Tax=Actinophytocola glycyrrhizae TaxID=2044873 RepID=A0ABV9RWZ8_9PSEU
MHSDDLAVALRLADAADEITMARFLAADLVVDRKPDRSPVTDADTAVEDTVRAIIDELRPGDDVMGEERGGAVGDGRTWIVDPIDGTKNFLRGNPVWATLIALVDGGTPVVGVVSAPAFPRRWHASAGGGAWCGERRLRVSGVGALADAYLSTTDVRLWESRDTYLALMDACWETRAFGDFWQHVLVAEGALDLAAEPIAYPWDLAAVQVIVTEAGGRFTDLRGEPRFDGGDALASNGLLHDAALGVLQAGVSAPRTT